MRECEVVACEEWRRVKEAVLSQSLRAACWEEERGRQSYAESALLVTLGQCVKSASCKLMSKYKIDDAQVSGTLMMIETSLHVK